jgi:hypothetical protein
MDWYVQEGTDAVGNGYRVAFLIPIPDTLNRVGVSNRTALLNSGIGGKSSLPEGDGTNGTMTAADAARIKAGAAYESVETMFTHPGENWAQFQAAIDARWKELKDADAQRLKHALAYYGGSGNVV